MSKSDGESIAIASPALAYATPARTKPCVMLYRIAQACWILPLVIGVGLLLLYLIASYRSLPALGVLTIVAGAGLFAVATVCLAAFKAPLARCDPDIRRVWNRRSNVLIGLLILNIPIALACFFVGVWLMQRHTVVVVNSTSSPIQDVSIVVARHRITFAEVPANGSASKTVTVQGEGGVDFTATQNGAQVAGSADVYLSGTDRGTTTINFTPSGVVTQSKP